ncbi:MAG: PKD domain-containing protein [Gallionella sp.]|nr:PKD domain-containing protein [Gallionella sp.]
MAGYSGGSSPDSNTATVLNIAPVSNAGQLQNIMTGALVTLNGSASTDANGDLLTYSWTLTSKPASSTATLAGSTSAAPTFTADVAGTYVALLTVSDGKVNSAIATVTVTAAPSGDTTISTQMGGARQGVPLNLTTAVTTLAGSGTAAAADGTGITASFRTPDDITTDGTNLYVADSSNNIIRKIVIATGAVTTLAGSGAAAAADGTGTAASFNTPKGITTDGTNLYVADYFNNKIRKIVIATGVVTTLAGSAGYLGMGSTDGTGTAASFAFPCGITTDGTNLYVADYLNNEIRKIVIATGVVTTLAGSAGYLEGGSIDGTGTAASFAFPCGITTDGTNLYVADSFYSKIRKIVIATGAVTTLAGVGTSGSVDGVGTAASFAFPFGITTDGTNLYVADTSNRKIRKIVIATGVVTTLAGSGAAAAVDGTGTSASISLPSGITTNGTNLYVTDRASNSIRRIQ